MTLNEIIELYGTNTLIISVLCAIAEMLIKKYLSDKAPKFICNYSHLLLAVVLEIAYDMIFISRAFIITDNAFYSGIIAGSLSGVITLIVGKLKRGESITLDALTLVIEGLLDGYVEDAIKPMVALSIAEIIKTDDSEKSQKILCKLKDNGNCLNEDELRAVVAILLKSTEQFNNK